MQGFLLLGFLVTSGALLWGLSQRKKVVPSSQPVPGTGNRPATAPTTALISLGDSLGVGLSPYLAAWATSKGLPFADDTKVGRFTKQQAVDVVPAGALVFVSLGTNDATSSAGAAALPTFAATLRACGPRAIVWLVPPATKALPGIAAVRDVISKLPGVTPVRTAVAVRSDGLHPSSYAAVFADVAPALEKATR